MQVLKDSIFKLKLLLQSNSQIIVDIPTEEAF